MCLVRYVTKGARLKKLAFVFTILLGALSSSAYAAQACTAAQIAACKASIPPGTTYSGCYQSGGYHCLYKYPNGTIIEGSGILAPVKK